LSRCVTRFSQAERRLLRNHGKEEDSPTTDQQDMIQDRSLSAVLLKVPSGTSVSV
jgi:hypothetical protein